MKTRKRYRGGNAGADLLETATNVAKKTANILDEFMPSSIISDFVGDNIANKDWNEVAPHFFTNLNETAQLISYAAKDHELRKVLENSIQVYGTALNDIFDIAKPKIMELTDKFWEMVDEIAITSAPAAVNAIIDSFSAAIAEVPLLGGAVDALIALSKWFNAVSSGIISPTTVYSGHVLKNSILAGRTLKAYNSQYGKDLSDTYNNVTDMLKKAEDMKTKEEQKKFVTPPTTGGGRRKPRSSYNTLRNIQSSIHRFTRKKPLTVRFD